MVLVAVCLHSYEYTIVDHTGTCGTIKEHTDSVLRNHRRPLAIWDHMGPCKTIWDHMELCGPNGTLQDLTGMLPHFSKGQLSKDNFVQGTLVQEDFCPRKHWSKVTFVQV